MPFGVDAGSWETCKGWASCRPFWGQTLPGSFLVSGYFVFFFVLGIGLAVHRDRVGLLLSRFPAWALLALLMGALGLLGSSVPASDLVFGIGATLLIVTVLNMRSLDRLLGLPPLRWLGRVSYSLYLIHLPVFLLVVYGLPGAATGVRLMLLVPLSLLAAWFFHRFVETPSRLCGRVLTSPAPIPIALPTASG